MPVRKNRGLSDLSQPTEPMSTLTFQQAQGLIAAAFSTARANGYKPMGLVVVDAAGQIKAAAREDGATALRIDIANGKASAALGMGTNSRVLAQRAKDLPAFLTALAAVSSQKFLPQTGAVLILDQAGATIGAAGASGGTGDEDEEICIAGIAAVGLKHA